MSVAAAVLLFAAMSANGEIAVVDSKGAPVAQGSRFDVVGDLAQKKCTVYAADSTLLAAVVETYSAAGQFGHLDISLRATGRGSSIQLLGVRRTGWPCNWRDLSTVVPDGDLGAAARGMGLDWAPYGDAADDSQQLRELGQTYLDWLLGQLGEIPTTTLAALAAKLGIPRSWRNAHAAKPRMSAEEISGWRAAERAYYGGRVTCRAPGWRGRAVEYDLRNAYGWALTRPIPDWKIYARRPWANGPAWYDVTVDVSGDLGALPSRDANNPLRLNFPLGKVRGVWTRDEIDRSGVQVLEQHGVWSGRWSLDLAPLPSQWLERRSSADSSDQLSRALYRFLPNALAGKLVQRSTGWILWPGDTGQTPPAGARPLGLMSSLWAVPVLAARQPVTCPQAGSYVTSLVRSAVWPELSRPDAIYSDTDSVHLPADAPPPCNVGSNAGQWAAKESGMAHYIGPKHYKIGNKQVRPALALQSLLAD